jgi:hypothetical protein
VKFLRLSESDSLASLSDERKDEVYTQLTNLLIEKSIYDAVPSFDEKGLLWNLSFLQVRSESDGEYDYEVMIKFHHVIADAISAYNTCLNLLHMIKVMHDNDQSHA